MYEFMTALGVWVLAPLGAIATVITIWDKFRPAPTPPSNPPLPAVTLTSESEDRALVHWDAERSETPGTFEYNVAQFLEPLAPLFHSDLFIEQPTLFYYYVRKRQVHYRAFQWMSPFLALPLGVGALLFLFAALTGRTLHADLPPPLLALL